MRLRQVTRCGTTTPGRPVLGATGSGVIPLWHSGRLENASYSLNASCSLMAGLLTPVLGRGDDKVACAMRTITLGNRNANERKWDRQYGSPRLRGCTQVSGADHGSIPMPVRKRVHQVAAPADVACAVRTIIGGS